MNIAILGGGSWGTALGVHLAKKNHKVKIWEFFAEQATTMQQERVCPLLPHVKLPKNIFVSHQMEKVLPGSELVLLVVPSDKVKATILNVKIHLAKQPIIICSKGFAEELKLLSEVVKETVKNEVYCLYGPTHAEEVGQGKFSGMVLAGSKGKEKLKPILESDNLRVELSDDLIGVQVAAALKNILAVFVGVLDGMKLGDNAKAYVMTKGLEEIKEIGVAWGAKEETFYGLAGLGDVIVTCSSQHSRNRYVGEQIGKGRKLDDVLKEMKMVAEGITALKQVPELKNNTNLSLPLLTAVYDILVIGSSPQKMLERL